jgi:hypothetical protein
MHANLGYQPEVPTKFQPNRTPHGWEIPNFVRPRLQTTTDWQTTTDYRHESQEAGKTIVRCYFWCCCRFGKLCESNLRYSEGCNFLYPWGQMIWLGAPMVENPWKKQRLPDRGKDLLFVYNIKNNQSLNQNMHTNLGYQPQVSTKFQLNRTAHGW